MTEWFGKGCPYLRARWEENETTGGSNYEEAVPVLTFCTHPANTSDHEGNCNPTLCPESKMIKKFETSEKDDTVLVLNQLLNTLKNADKIEKFQFTTTNEVQQVPTHQYMKEELTGWIVFNLNIRLKVHQE